MPFWKQVVLSPLGAALFGTVLAGLILSWVQIIREKRQLRQSLSFEIMQLGYAFYNITEEGLRRLQYDGPHADLQDLELDALYQDFRIASRVLEQKLNTYLKKSDARWHWHNVIDVMSVRYYGLMHGGKRLDDLVSQLAKHPTDSGFQ